jgi:hypothetical protein
LPTAPAVQFQIEKLSATNRLMQEELDKWHAYYAAEMAARNNALPNQTPPPNVPSAGRANPISPGFSTASLRPNIPPVPGVAASFPRAPIHLRTHVVTSGETLASIARKARVSLSALENINPGLNPKRLRRGQTINLP